MSDAQSEIAQATRAVEALEEFVRALDKMLQHPHSEERRQHVLSAAKRTRLYLDHSRRERHPPCLPDEVILLTIDQLFAQDPATWANLIGELHSRQVDRTLIRRLLVCSPFRNNLAITARRYSGEPSAEMTSILNADLVFALNRRLSSIAPPGGEEFLVLLPMPSLEATTIFRLTTDGAKPMV